MGVSLLRLELLPKEGEVFFGRGLGSVLVDDAGEAAYIVESGKIALSVSWVPSLCVSQSALLYLSKSITIFDNLLTCLLMLFLFNTFLVNFDIVLMH